MVRNTVVVGVVASLLGFSPQTAKADIADGIIGGVVGGAVGALVTESIRNNNSKKKSSSGGKTTTSSKATYGGSSLNSQYSRAERIQIQTSLNNLGYNVGTVDGVLGKRSRAGIAAFQASRNEVSTGQLTAAQFAALTNGGFGNAQAAFIPNNRPLQTNEVFLLQQSLWQMGFFQGTIDGVNGVTTQNAATNYLISQNRNPMQTTHVQTLVLAAGSVGQTVPQYLIDEANAQYAAAQSGNVFGGQGNAQQGTTMVNQQQGGNALFGAPTQPAAGQTQQVFGGQQQQQQAPATTNSLFGTVPQQQQQQVPQQQPEANGVLVSAPQGDGQTEILSTKDSEPAMQGTTQTDGGLFAAQSQQPTTADGTMVQSTSAQQSAFQEQSGSTLDIFTGSN